MIRSTRPFRLHVAVAAGVLLSAAVVGVVENSPAAAESAPTITQVDLTGPLGSSSQFGRFVTVLTNGNYVVNDPGFSAGPFTDIGAVYLYDGGNDALIALLTGSTSGDQVGNRGVVPLANGNYLVRSDSWQNGAATDAGAVTFGDGETGISGQVSAANSLVGSSPNDRVGSSGVLALANGDYVVRAPGWDNGALVNVGAATFGDGNTGVSGPVSTLNSLHGTTIGDSVGREGAIELSNGEYVVISPEWANGAATEAGAVTRGASDGSTVGPVTTVNSLHGTSIDDQVGYGRVTPLASGDYVVSSPMWDIGGVADAGAVTWVDGTAGLTGPVTTTNSLHGSTSDDRVGEDGITPLVNGGYVVSSESWANGSIAEAGAATFVGASGDVVGPVTTANSLHGESTFDGVGGYVEALSNGNYVVGSPGWANGALQGVGAVTFANGTSGISGAVSTANSLHGTQQSDLVGSGGVIALANGNYVVISSGWANGGVAQAGAVTFANGVTGITGPVTTGNSLHGTTAGDSIGSSGVVPLANGNFVVLSPRWRNGPTLDAGAATLGDGSTGISGAVTTLNSLHGTMADDQVGRQATPLSDGNFVVVSREWNSPVNPNVGAVTHVNAETGLTGPVTFANSHHGQGFDDFVGTNGVVPLDDGDYVIVSGSWRAVGELADQGAVTFGSGPTGVTGPVTLSNSVIGTPPGDIEKPDNRLTSNDALPVPTTQGRVLLMQLDRAPSFSPPSPDVSVAAVGNALSATATYPTPTAYDLRSATTPPVSCTPASGSVFLLGDTTVTCSATDPGGLTGTTSFTVTVLAPDIVSLTPARFLDTRAGQDTADGQAELGAAVPAGEFVEVQITGRVGVPLSRVGAAVINVTAINPLGRGFVTMYPCGTRPLASSLNYPTSGTVVANEVIAKLSASGTVCAYTSQTTHLAFDVVAYVPTTSSVKSLTPARILETRAGQSTADGRSELGAAVPAGTFVEVQVTGRQGIPAGAGAAIINVTAINPLGRGFVTMYPCGTRPLASSLNYPAAGGVVANEVVAKLTATGKTCAYTSATTHLAFDVVGYVPTASTVKSITPARILETRSGQNTEDGQGELGATVQAGAFVEVQVTGRVGVPAGATAAVINVTAINPFGRGFVTMYPCDTRPLASSLNFSSAGTVVANEVIAKLSASGAVCAYTSSTTHLAFDVVGHITPA